MTNEAAPNERAKGAGDQTVKEYRWCVRVWRKSDDEARLREKFEETQDVLAGQPLRLCLSASVKECTVPQAIVTQPQTIFGHYLVLGGKLLPYSKTMPIQVIILE